MWYPGKRKSQLPLFYGAGIWYPYWKVRRHNDMRIDNEFMNCAMKQFALDLNIEEGAWISDKIHLSPAKILDGARMHVKHDTFFKAVIFISSVGFSIVPRLAPPGTKLLARSAPENKVLLIRIPLTSVTSIY